MDNNRIGWIDICKTFGIFLVILGHVGSIDTVNIWKASFYMPMFFLLSGYCFDEKKYSKFIYFFKKRFLSLLLPYIIFSILLYFLWNCVAYFFFTDKFGSFLNIFNCIIFPASNTSCFGAVNWFLPSLFVSELLFYYICKINKSSIKKIILMLLFFSLISYIYPNITNYRIPLAIDSSLMGLFFYGIGWYIRKIDFSCLKDLIKKHLLLSIIVIIFLLLFFAQLSFVNGMTNIRTLMYGDYLLYLINAIGISLLIMAFSMLIDKKFTRAKIVEIFRITGRHTLIIMLFNSVFANIYNNAMIVNNMIITSKIKYMINNSFVSVIILIICVLISIFVNKYLPWLLGRKRKL